jgi:hypothetical protein
MKCTLITFDESNEKHQQKEVTTHYIGPATEPTVDIVRYSRYETNTESVHDFVTVFGARSVMVITDKLIYICSNTPLLTFKSNLSEEELVYTVYWPYYMANVLRKTLVKNYVMKLSRSNLKVIVPAVSMHIVTGEPLGPDVKLEWNILAPRRNILPAEPVVVAPIKVLDSAITSLEQLVANLNTALADVRRASN